MTQITSTQPQIILEGLFSDVPLIGVLSILHDTKQSGLLQIEVQLPFYLRFSHGEVVAGGILDWTGLDAIQSCPVIPDKGSFSFQVLEPVAQPPLLPYDPFTTEWARVSDEWQQNIRLLGSPSVMLRGTLPPIFNQPEGCSVRAAAAFAQSPLADMASKSAVGVREGKLTPTGRYAWFDVVLPRPAQPITQLAQHLDGEASLGQLIDGGLDLNSVRIDLMAEINLGMRFDGCGWVLRDLIWEMQHEQQQA